MSIFGWSLPPGVSLRDIDPPEQPCELCGEESGWCECPECPECGAYGDKKCYHELGHMEMTKEQSLRWFLVQREWLLQARADSEADTAYAEDMKDWWEL